MSSAFRWFLPELLAAPRSRAARRGRAFALLDEGLGRVFLANASGEATFGLSPGEAPDPLLVRQIRSGARALRDGATVPLLVRVPSARVAIPLAATAARLVAQSGTAILLATRDERTNPGADARRVLAALEDERASILAVDGTPVAGEFPLPDADGWRDETLAFAVAGTPFADIAGGRVRLFRIEDDLILTMLRDTPSETVEPGDRDGATEEVAPDGMSDTRPRPLRSIWGVALPAAGARAADGTAASADDEPPGETRQPVERESVVIVPDLPPDDADAMDPPISTDEEVPVEPDGDVAPLSDDEPGLGVDAGIHVPARPEPEADEGSAFVARLDAPPVRFVWQIDAEGRFRSLSPEFAEAVGPRAAAVAGRAFDEVAEAFGFDETGAIRRLLDRRDTWSGRTVFWPVEGTDRRVPIDLAALPTYSRDRVFDGFRGFGIVRGADHQPDPAARGLALARPPAEAEAQPEATAEPSPPRKPLIRTFEADLPGVSFGRRQNPPQLPVVAQNGAARSERRRSSEATLSEAEEAAFREIGAKLGQQRSEAETPGALRFESLVPGPVSTDEGAERRETPAPEEPADGAASEPASAEGAAIAAGGGDGLAAADIEPLLAAFPLPVLVRSRDALVYANRAFAEFSGYADVGTLSEAGGLEALFAEPAGEPTPPTMRVRRADGETVEVGVHMQRVAFAGHSSLLMTFERPSPAAAPNEGAEDLRREVGELRAVLDIATDGVVIVDPEGTIRAANGSAEALFGMGPQEFSGRPLADLFAHESRKAVLGYLETLKDKGLAGVMNDGREVIGRVAQGGFVPLFITVGRVPDERGWCVVIRDMSHWKRIEEELVNAKRAAEAASLHKSRFLANISHELRTPLNAIIGFADVMASECFGPIGNERYVEYLGDIKRSGHHVLDLVNDLLDISKIEAGRMELSFEAVSLNEILAEVVATMQPQANRERVIVRSNLPASVPPVVADRRTIRQIALNLLSNSVRFTPAGGQIIASTTYTAEGDVLLRVRDSGIGMTPSEIEVAMTPFQQVHKPEAGRGTGTGLGLPLTKAMAEANRASFAIRSTPGEGTLVEIAFPSQRVLAD